MNAGNLELSSSHHVWFRSLKRIILVVMVALWRRCAGCHGEDRVRAHNNMSVRRVRAGALTTEGRRWKSSLGPWRKASKSCYICPCLLKRNRLPVGPMLCVGESCIACLPPWVMLASQLPAFHLVNPLPDHHYQVKCFLLHCIFKAALPHLGGGE